jgi:ABC-type multidrug transport system ATPase subunit
MTNDEQTETLVFPLAQPERSSEQLQAPPAAETSGVQPPDADEEPRFFAPRRIVAASNAETAAPPAVEQARPEQPAPAPVVRRRLVVSDRAEATPPAAPVAPQRPVVEQPAPQRPVVEPPAPAEPQAKRAAPSPLEHRAAAPSPLANRRPAEQRRAEPRRDQPRPEPQPQPPVVNLAPTADEDSARGVLLEAQTLRREVAKGKVILHDVSLVARPGEFVAVVGGSGAGKSTLLGALSGYRPATSGRVLLDGVPLYQHYNELRQLIGYVPQDDIIHRELTVERALTYAAELRLPVEWTPAQRQERVDAVIAELALKEQRQTVVADLSGGQRKRVSIGVELLTRPRLFFLDEPTSGLDPATETHMMDLLRGLANQGRTVLLITHATQNIHLCDKVLFLARGGRIAFYGPPDEALTYFGVQHIEQIYDLLQDDRSPEQWEQQYRESPFYQREIAGRMEHDAATVLAPRSSGRKAAGREEDVRQFKILTRRYAEIVLRDRKNLLILLAQGPVIAVLMWALFGAGIFTRPSNEWLFVPGIQPIPLTAANSQLVDKVIAQENQQAAQAKAANQPKPTLVFYSGPNCGPRTLGAAGCDQDGSSGNGNAAKAAQLMFILAATAVWLGTLNAVREISKEDAIYRRERMVSLRVLPYIGSKFAVLLGLVVVQTALLFGVAALHVGFPASALPGIYLALLFGAAASVAVALAVSAAVSNPDRAVFAAPLIMLPQIFFAGLLVPVASLGIAQPLAAIVTSRWTFEAASRAADLGNVAAFAPGLPYHTSFEGTMFVGLGAMLLMVVAFGALAVGFQLRKDNR